MPRVNPHDPTPAYLQIANTLRREIETGELTHGAPLASQRAMEAEFGVSGGTIRQALDELTAEGLIYTRKGKGAFVRRPRRYLRDGSRRHLRSRRPDGTAPTEAESANQGFRRRTVVVGVGRTPAPPRVAEALGIQPGADVFGRHNLIFLDDEVAQTASSYFPIRLITGSAIERPEPVPGGVHTELERVSGRRLGLAREDLIARMPTAAESSELQLPPGTPVVELWRTICDVDGAPMEVTSWLFDGSRHTFRYDVPMD